MSVCICATPNQCLLPHCILFPFPLPRCPIHPPNSTLTGSRVYRAEKPHGTLASPIQNCTLHRKGNKMPNETTSPGRFPFGNAIRRAGFRLLCVLSSVFYAQLRLYPSVSAFGSRTPTSLPSAQLSESVCPCTLQPHHEPLLHVPLVLNCLLRLGAIGGTLIQQERRFNINHLFLMLPL